MYKSREIFLHGRFIDCSINCRSSRSSAILWVKGQSWSNGLLGLRKVLSSHFDVGQDGGLFDSLIDFRWGSLRAAESQTHAVAVIEGVIPEPVGRPDRAFWRNPGSASNHSLFSDVSERST